MKTSKFENTLRRKLESIEPDFQEQDWARMQNYMQTHTPPSFLQQYGSWIGYAAAASVTSVMAYMYVGQLSQNDHLVRDVKNLQSQIELIKNQPSQADTVYVLQTAPDGQSLQASLQPRDYRRIASPGTLQPHVSRNGQAAQQSFATEHESESNREASSSNANADQHNASEEMLAADPASREAASVDQGMSSGANAMAQNQQPQAPANPADSKTFGSGLPVAEINAPVEMQTGISLQRKMHYELASKLSTRQVQRALLAHNFKPAAKSPVSGKKAEQLAQAETVIPKLPLKTPYRFGAAYQVEGNGQGKTVMGEVIIKKKFSIAAGITWLKVKPAEFFTETIFREKARKDFKETHPGQVPQIFQLYNIKIDQSVVQMPLTLAFRNTVKDDWAYYASMGTNIRLSTRETVSYDCRGPKDEFFNQSFSKKGDISPITSMNFAVGIEKSWHPIVVQAEGYWVNYFKPITPFRHSAGPGLRVKLLYQIGRQL
ncbi:hypothetical protein Dfer_2807 [Dyadobacter fermentans DSM 18053]|uniref:Outer membrane protein beta-barrel domain-containing protein n=2 Tax=Dyadobacter fermentans TaxID=94254 RepID=C6W4C1_DYAFD|nr:hypothetical protein Dfer_2807 [Dyadobacter fermentans DSM 18053]